MLLETEWTEAYSLDKLIDYIIDNFNTNLNKLANQSIFD